MNRSKQPTESERRRHELSHLPHVPWCTICCRARTIDDAHHVVIHEESVDSLPKIVRDYAEIKMKGDTTPMRVLLVVDSSTGYLGATDVGQKGGSSGFAAKWLAKWLESTGYARMRVQSDAEQSIEHLLKAVKSICTADLIVQRAPVKSDFCSIGMDTEPFSLASQQTSATQRRSDIIRTSHRKSIQISDSSVVPDGGVFDTIRSRTWRSSRGCERNTTKISINVGSSHRGKR